MFFSLAPFNWMALGEATIWLRPRKMLPVADPERGGSCSSMFTVTEAEAAAIRQAFERDGEFAAAVELRRLFPAIVDIAQARDCVRYRGTAGGPCGDGLAEQYEQRKLPEADGEIAAAPGPFQQGPLETSSCV